MPVETPVLWCPAAAPGQHVPHDLSSRYSDFFIESRQSGLGQGREAMPSFDVPSAGYNSSFQQSPQDAALSTYVPPLSMASDRPPEPVMYDNGMSARYTASSPAWSSHNLMSEGREEDYTDDSRHIPETGPGAHSFYAGDPTLPNSEWSPSQW